MSEPIHGCASSTLTLDDVLHQQHSAHQEVVNVDEPHTQLVFFALGDVHFAFPGRHVQEILAGTDTPVHFIPGCPPHPGVRARSGAAAGASAAALYHRGIVADGGANHWQEEP